MIQWLLYSLPWQLQIALLAVPVGIAFIVVGNIIGWDKVRVFIVPAIGALAAIGLLGRARQQGAADQRVKQERVDQRARDTIAEGRKDVADDTDPELDARLNRWTKDKP